MRIALAAAAALVILVVAARPAEACRCMPPAPPAEALAAVDAVFVGQVAEVKTVDATGTGRVEVVLEVEEWFKGGRGPRAEVITAASSAACGFTFTQGRSYLVYAGQRDEGTLQVSLCSRTRPLERADEDLAVLRGEAAGPKPETGGSPEADKESDPAGATGGSPEAEPPASESPGDLGGRNSGRGRGCAAAGSAPGALGALFALTAFAAVRRRYSRASKSSAAELMQ
jgi:hypothetical protein